MVNPIAIGCIAALMATATAAAQNFVIEYDSLQRDSAELSSASFSFEGGLTPLSAQGVSADFQMLPVHCENSGVACSATAGGGGGEDATTTVVGGGGGGGKRNLSLQGSRGTYAFGEAPPPTQAIVREEETPSPTRIVVAEPIAEIVEPLGEEPPEAKPSLPIVTVTIRDLPSPTFIEDVSRTEVPVTTAPLPRANQYTLAGVSVAELGVLSRLSRIYAFRNLYGAIPAYAYGWGGISVLPFLGGRKRWKTRRICGSV